jgi:hypothetical protein
VDADTCLYLLLFLATTILMVLFVRCVRRRLDRYMMVACIANVFIVWFLFALSAITSDPISREALSTIRLASMHVWIWGVAYIWWAPLMYVLFNAIDQVSEQVNLASNPHDENGADGKGRPGLLRQHFRP